jgi:hypothetical protein
MEKMKRVLIAGVILAVIVVMALRGCPKVRRGRGIAYAALGQGGAGFTGVSLHQNPSDFSMRPECNLPVTKDDIKSLYSSKAL